ncbi:putative drug/proton antiporter [Escovopsis weberi]|uniref:Putative drug/proton antiporter n=1 Tax=Escovopsis weberi TaxID=150374 RepID=A0A0M8N4Z3_ESCWE|nr:putative drug/proton antiporter [Escovopsis weberi]
MIGITSYCIGFAVTPMLLAPLSEIRGRRPVFVIAGAFFVLFQGLSSVMPDAAGMIVCRLFAGVGGSVFSTVVGGVLADVYANHERNTPMALFAGSALVAAGAGPLVGAAMMKNLGSDTLTWKWTFWLQTIGNGLLVITLFLFFPESRRSVILSKKARVLNRWYEKLENVGAYGVLISCGPSVPETSASSSVSSVLPAILSGDVERNGDGKDHVGSSRKQPRRIRWVVKEDEERASMVQIIAISVKRPFQLLVTEPVVFCFSLWAAFSWAVLYLSFSIVPLLYTGGNSFNESTRVYVAIMIASVAGTIVSIYQDRLLKHPQWMRHHPDEHFQYSYSRFWALLRRRFPAEAPEARLYFAAIAAVLLPVGLFLALMTELKDGSYTQAIGLGLSIWGIYAVYLSTFNYLADTYHTYASSALAVQSCCRNLLGGAFPLLAGIMFQRMGPKGMGGLLGGIATVLTLIPWVLIFLGEKIRSKSKVALSLGES